MKKALCIMVLACVIMGAAFAQQKPAAQAEGSGDKKNSAALDVFQLFKGFIATNTDGNNDFTVFILSAAYERLLVPHFSLGGDLDMYFMNYGSTPGFYFGLAAEGRYYPLSDNFDKFFLGATLGFNALSIDGKTKSNEGGFFGLIVSLKTGYKLITSKNIYIEPSLGYVMSKSSMLSGLSAALGGPSIPTPNGWNGGLRVGFVF